MQDIVDWSLGLLLDQVEHLWEDSPVYHKHLLGYT